MDDRELLWNNFKMNVELYRSYLDLVIKINLFYYAITGAIVSFYFAHQDEDLIKYSLLFPIIMSTALAVFFFYGANLAKVMRLEIFNVAKTLGLQAAPEAQVLIAFLWVFASIFLLVSITLGWLVLCR